MCPLSRALARPLAIAVRLLALLPAATWACQHGIWKNGFGCADNPSFDDGHGYDCGDFDHNCVGAVEMYAYTAEQEQAIIRNCPVSCGTCPCEDAADYVGPSGQGCGSYAGGCEGAAERWNWTAGQERELLVRCPRACGLCTCWDGCIAPAIRDGRASPAVVQLYNSTAHFREKNAGRLVSLGPPESFSNDLMNSLVSILATDLLGYSAFVKVVDDAYDTKRHIRTRNLDVQLEFWGNASDADGLEFYPAGYTSKEGVYVAGVRYADCEAANADDCKACTSEDVARGVCASISDGMDSYASHLSPRVRHHFPPVGTLAAVNLTRSHFEVWPDQTVLTDEVMSALGGDGPLRYVPPHCREPGPLPCMEMLHYSTGPQAIERLVERTRFPYHVLSGNTGFLRRVVTDRSANSLATVFTYWEPEPWLYKVGASRIAFPLRFSACAVDGYGFALGCEVGDSSIDGHNVVSRNLAEKAPEMYHAIRGPLRVSEFALAEMFKLHQRGGGNITDTMVAACSWMLANPGQVASWVPACGPGAEVFIESDGSTSCCHGQVKRSMFGNFSVCVLRCDPATEVPNVPFKRCDRRCPAGTVLDQNNSINGCVLCAPGTEWVAVPDPLLTGVSAECQACAAGQFNSQGGATSCEVCSNGTFAPAGSIACLACPSGTHPGRAGQEACRCDLGYYRPPDGMAGVGEACLACPDPLQTTLFIGASGLEDCVCSVGSYSRPSGEEDVDRGCTACSSGMLCLGQERAPLQRTGFFAEVTGPLGRDYSVYLCRNGKECPEGPPGTCAPGRQGLACSRCLDKHYPTSSGACLPCAGGDATPFPVAIGACCLVLVLLLLLAKADLSQQRLALVTLPVIGGQFAGLLQTVGIFKDLAVPWSRPISDLLKALSIITFNLDILKAPCVMGTDAPVATFVLQLLLAPMAALGLILVMGVLRACRRPVGFNHWCNSFGSIVLTFCITLTLTALRPFNCLPNPNRTSSLASDPGIICWEKQHIGMACLGIAGIAAYPASIGAVVLWVTLQYPRWITTSRGMRTVQRFQWLFVRFKLERYYFGAILLLRSGLLALTPVAFPGKPVEQVLAMSTALLAYLVSLCRFWPWRTYYADFADLGMCAGLLLCMVCAAFLVPADEQTQRLFGSKVASFAAAALVFSFALTAIVTVWVCFRVARPRVQYGAFLCHHKGGAGVLARHFKSRIGDLTSTPVFLDADNLVDLDCLFDIVRVAVRQLVVLGTKQTLLRMWCAGEITTAYVNRVPILVVAADDYAPPDERLLQQLHSAWSEEDKCTLDSFGIDIPKIQAAYVHLLSSDSVAFPRFGSSGAQQAAIERAAQKSRLRWSSGRTLDLDLLEPEVIVAGNSLDAESLSCQQVVSDMVQRFAVVQAAAVRSVDEFKAYGTQRARKLIVLLTKGLFTNADFARLMLATRRRGDMVVATVLADSSFAFPGNTFYDEVERGSVLPADGPELSTAYQELSRVLALPLSPRASLGVLRRQVEEICGRLHHSQKSGTQAWGRGPWAARHSAPLPDEAVKACALGTCTMVPASLVAL